MAGVNGNDVGDVELMDAGIMHRDTIGALQTQVATLREIANILKGSADAGTSWDLPVQTHARIRCAYLVFTNDAACVVTINTGTGTRTFNIPSADTRVLPFPFVIDRGQDVSLSFSAGAGSGYLIGWAE